MFTAALIFATVLGFYDGNYQRPCNMVDDEAYLTSRVSVQDRQWVVAHTAYEEEQCQKAYLTYETHYKVQEVTEREIDMSVLEVSYTVHTDETAEALNTIRFCGFEDWQKDVTKDISGAACEDFEPPAKGEVIYSIADLNLQGELRLGEPSGSNRGKTPNSRHQKLESLPFLKSE